MKRILSLLLVIAMLLGCVAALSSCGESDNGAEISVYLGNEVCDFDPTAYYTSSNAEQVMSLLFEPLFSINAKGNVENAAAKGYSVDETNRTITVQLKETYWSDSERLTAADFIYAWRDVLLEPNNANPAAALLYDIENAKDIKAGSKSLYEFGAVASDKYEITITYRDGADYKTLIKNLASLATSPLREDIITVYNRGYWSKTINTLVSNGPFKVADFEANSFTVARNVGYHQKPTTSNVTGKVVPSKLVTFISGNGSIGVSYADIESKTIFYMGDASLEERAANKDNAIVTDDLSTYTYVFNTDKPLFANEKVRQALSIAIDREAIVSAITFGKVATGLLTDNVIDTATGKSFRTDSLISATAKMTEAKELLSSVDFTGLEKTITLTVEDNEESLAIANLVKSAWSELGFTVEIEALGTVANKVVDFSSNTELDAKDSAIQAEVIGAARGNRDFDVIAVDWQMYSTDAFVALAAFSSKFSGNGYDFEKNQSLGSFGGWVSEEYDDLIEKAYNATLKADRSQALHDAESLLIESACIVPLVYNSSFAFVSSELSDVKTDGLGNFVFTRAKQKNYKDYLD